MRYLLFCFILSISSLMAEPQETTVKAKEARFDGLTLMLEGDVAIQNEMGMMMAKRADIITAEKKSALDMKGKWEVNQLKISGDVTFQLARGGILKCDNIEGDKGVLQFFGAPEIHYKDEMGEVFAKSGRLVFEEKEGHLQPLLIILTGGVRMVKNGEEGPEYALADRVEYDPYQKKLRLISEDAPVLFVSEKKGIKLSAKEVVAIKKEKEEIFGVGDVQVVFKEEELNRLKEQFPWINS